MPEQIMRRQLLFECTCAHAQGRSCTAWRQTHHASIRRLLHCTQGHPGRAGHERGFAAAAGVRQAAVGAAIPLRLGCGGRSRRHVSAARPCFTQCSRNKSGRSCNGGAVYVFSRLLCVRQGMSCALLAGWHQATRGGACAVVRYCTHNPKYQDTSPNSLPLPESSGARASITANTCCNGGGQSSAQEQQPM